MRTDRAALLHGLATAGFDAAVAEPFLRALRAWAISKEGLEEAHAALTKAAEAAAAYERDDVAKMMRRELDELEPALRAQLAEADARNFAKRAKKG